MLATIRAGSSHYELVEGDDHDALRKDDFPIGYEHDRIASSSGSVANSRASFETSSSSPAHARVPRLFDYTVPIRTVSREGSAMRHPTPDLQSLQGAYVGNVERLEETAERLSLSSDIGEELRKIRQEQKRSESRSSSVRAAQFGLDPLHHSLSRPSRQFSTSSNASNSILGLNSRARSGGFSNSFFTSPVGSVRSPSWTHHPPRQRQTSQTERMARVSGPGREGRPTDAPIESHPDGTKPMGVLRVINHELEESPVELEDRGIPALEAFHQDPEDTSGVGSERPDTATSTDTCQRGMHLFADFDGVHLSNPQDEIPPEYGHLIPTHGSSLLSLSQNSSDDEQESMVHHPSRVDNMIYYPAPVPMMLNLPQRLSNHLPVSQRDYRRSQMNEVIPGARQSSLGLPELLESHNEGRDSRIDDTRRDSTHLPPQLRAEIFFEHKPIQQDVVVKGDSAVATLDSILDASAFAPVSAFIDHPIVGQIGKEVYGKAGARRSTIDPLIPKASRRKSLISLNILKHRQSTATNLDSDWRFSSAGSGTKLGDIGKTTSQVESRTVSGESEAARYAHDDTAMGDIEDENSYLYAASEGMELGEDNEDALGGEGDESIYIGAPTTLLAELQLRKQQQQQRGRTAATAFPNGMHSTLLELDAVAQVQRQTRGRNQVMLAWEDPSHRNAEVQNTDDEDVPLGVLYPGRKVAMNDLSGRFDDNRPLGLIAKRAMEDNEPLSRRRERLKGNSTAIPSFTSGVKASTYVLEVPGLTDAAAVKSSNNQQETLGQRLRRLKNPKGQLVAKLESDGLLSDVLSSFGGPLERSQVVASTDRRTPDPEETLGQRRKRLQAEKAVGSREVSGEKVNIVRSPAQTTHTMADILHASRSTAPRSTSYQSESSKPSPYKQEESGLDGSLRHLTQGPGYINQTVAPIKQPLSNQNSTPATTYANPLASNKIVTDTMDYTGMGLDGTRDMLPISQDPELIDPKQAAMINRWRQSVMF